MPYSPAALAKIAHLRTESSAAPEIIPKLPPYPEDVRKRFPSLEKHQADLEDWRVKASIAIKGGAQ